MLKRPRILTDTPYAVNSGRVLVVVALAALLATLASGVRAAGPVPTTGDLRLLVILAGFPDRPLGEPRTHFVGGPESLVDRLVGYYAEVSSGRLRIVPHLAGPIVTLPEPRARYVQRSSALAGDALRALAAAATDEADRGALRDSQAVVVFFPGPGRESYMRPGESGDPWSNYTELTPPVLGFDEACVVAASQYEPLSSFGVLCHEFGHLLGLPELYAPGGAAHEGIGKWGLMGQGTWVGRGEHPPPLDAWSKVKLGWVDVVTVDRTTPGVRVPAVATEPVVVKIPAVPGKPQEYYLLENRERTGSDRGIPGDGILVWHVDESVGGFRTAQSNPRHKLLHLVEADGRGDLDVGTRNGGNRGDAGDAWAGPPRWQRRVGNVLAFAGAVYVMLALYRTTRRRSLVVALLYALIGGAALWGAGRLRAGPVCGPQTPGMAPYGGEPGRVVLRNFSPAGPVMQVDVLVAPAGAPAAAAPSG